MIEPSIQCQWLRLQWLPSLVTSVDCANRSGSATALELAMEEAEGADGADGADGALGMWFANGE